jgi:hypothetical protein
MTPRVVFLNERTLQPGCVMIQAVLGGDRQLLNEHFDSDDWQVDRIEAMRPCPEHLLERAAAARGRIRGAP